MGLCACNLALDRLRALATRRLRLGARASLLVAIVCGWHADTAAWEGPVPSYGLPTQAVRGPPADLRPTILPDDMVFGGADKTIAEPASRIWTPSEFARLVSAQSPTVDLPTPTFLPPSDELHDGTNTGLLVARPSDANDGCGTMPRAGSGRKSHIWRWVPRGKIPYIAPQAPGDAIRDNRGEPLLAAGWRSQPFSITAFAGATAGGALIPGSVNQQPSFYGGLNFGWDYDDYWGIEKRLGFGALDLTDGNHRAISKTGMSVTGEYRLMYYPLGDRRCRPFLTAGLGWSDFYFNDDQGVRHLDTTGVIPFGFGVKYLYSERVVVRVDLIDEVNFGTGPLSTFQYVALTGGLEFRYGKRLLNMPWHRKEGPSD